MPIFIGRGAPFTSAEILIFAPTLPILASAPLASPQPDPPPVPSRAIATLWRLFELRGGKSMRAPHNNTNAEPHPLRCAICGGMSMIE